jgi:hypothetical protein
MKKALLKDGTIVMYDDFVIYHKDDSANVVILKLYDKLVYGGPITTIKSYDYK